MTEISRISSLAIFTNATNNSNRTKANLANLQDQLSSGLKGKEFADFHGQVEQMVGLEKEVKRLQMYIDNNAETTSRLSVMEKSLQNMYQIAEDVKKNLTLRNNPVFNNSQAFEIQTRNFIQTMAKELNVSISGRFLFAGTNTDLPPVIDDPVPAPNEVGVPDKVYYQGSEENVITRIQDNIDLEYDIRADDEAFQKYFAALWLSLEGNSENNIEKINQAQDMIDESLANMNKLIARVQTKRTNVDDIVTRQRDTKTYFNTVFLDIASVDTVEVASRVAIDQATLQATYQVFARISSLNLSDFLR
jgi:flagellar hook-associated protein 3 FlgL